MIKNNNNEDGNEPSRLNEEVDNDKTEYLIE